MARVTSRSPSPAILWITFVLALFAALGVAISTYGGQQIVPTTRQLGNTDVHGNLVVKGDEFGELRSEISSDKKSFTQELKSVDGSITKLNNEFTNEALKNKQIFSNIAGEINSVHTEISKNAAAIALVTENTEKEKVAFVLGALPGLSVFQATSEQKTWDKVLNDPSFAGISVPLGTEARVGERHFRYFEADSTVGVGGISAGNLLAQQISTNSDYQNLGLVSTVAAGSSAFVLQVTATPTEDLFKEGYAFITGPLGGSNIGKSYRISGNTAKTGGNFTINFYGKTDIGVNEGTCVTLNTNPYKGLVLTDAAASVTTAPVGVATTLVSGSSFGWVQTNGPVSIKSGVSSGYIGKPVTNSIGTSGQIQPVSAVNETQLGTIIATGTSASLILLNI